MKIAFIGQKGIPSQWGGIEAHVEELAAELVQLGHQVYVYVRNWYSPEDIQEHRGVHILRTPTMQTKHLDAITHSLTSSIHSRGSDFDIIHYHAIGPAFFSWIPKRRAKIICTIHRFDYQADKWGRLAQTFLKLSERIALAIPDQTIVVAKHQQAFYSSLGKKTSYIPNGVRAPKKKAVREIATKYGLHGRDYILFMGRLVPEKRPDQLITAFQSYAKKNSAGKLVIAGGSSSTPDYVDYLKKIAKDQRDIIFTDYVSGRTKEELLTNARLFVIPSVLEGLPIALLEAMSYGLLCLASDIPAHQEVVSNGQNGFLFENDNAQALEHMLQKTLEVDSQSIGKRATRLVQDDYDWPVIAEKTVDIYTRALALHEH